MFYRAYSFDQRLQPLEVDVGDRAVYRLSGLETRLHRERLHSEHFEYFDSALVVRPVLRVATSRYKCVRRSRFGFPLTFSEACSRLLNSFHVECHLAELRPFRWGCSAAQMSREQSVFEAFAWLIEIGVDVGHLLVGVRHSWLLTNRLKKSLVASSTHIGRKRS